MTARSVLLALALAGCSDDDNSHSTSDAGLDASTDLASTDLASTDLASVDLSVPVDAAVPTDLNGVACNNGPMVLLDAIPVVQSTDVAPTLSGGTLKPGNYPLVAQTLYQQLDAGLGGYVTEKMFIMIEGNTIELYSDTPNPSSFLSPLFGAAESGTFTAGTHELQITTTCGDPTGNGHVYTMSYLATTNTITIDIGQSQPMYLTFMFQAS